MKFYRNTVRLSRFQAEVYKIFQVKEAQNEGLTNNQLILDQKLWDLGDYIVPTVKKVLKNIGKQG